MRSKLFMFCLAPCVAFAQDTGREYEVTGEKIISVETTQVAPKDPFPLAIGLSSGATWVIESDMPLDDCKSNFELAAGDPDLTVVVVVDENAQTLNGILVTRCAILQD